MDTKGKYTYRMRAFKAYPILCAKCGYDADDRMLDVDHIDSNRNNTGLDNLQILCVWCHAKKTRANWNRYVKAKVPEF